MSAKSGNIRSSCGGSLCPRTEDGLLKPGLIPAFRKRPPDTGRVRSLQILGDRSLPDPAASGDLPLPETGLELQTKDFFDLAHGQSPGRQSDPPLAGRITCR
jgi:hypothetical protein